MIDAIAILRSGLFMHSAYAHRYLGGRGWLWLSLAHYLWIGEAKGHRPNPFYDPQHVGLGPNMSLGGYLRDRKLWGRAPSSLFDPAFYRANLPEATRVNPLAHFWRHGFDGEKAASARFDTAFFKAVVAFYRRDKKEFAFEALTSERFVPGDEAAHLDKTRAFQDGIRLSVLRTSTTTRRHLVFVQANRSFCNPFPDPGRTFDVLINDYAATGTPTDADYDPRFDLVTIQGGTKTTAIRKLLADAPDILLRYDYVFFLDDDVGIDEADVERLFAIAAAQGLDLAQPSLTAASFCAFDILKQPAAGSGLTPLTAVEIMMPLISRQVLAECGWVFAEGVSGWAVDFLLGAEVRRRFGNTIALVGGIVAAHERGIDTQDGAFYRFLRSHGIEAPTEAGLIANRHGIEVSAKAIRRHPEPLRPPI